MQAIVQDNYGSAEVLQLRDIEQARRSGSTRCWSASVRPSVNPADWAIMSGLPYIARPRRTDCASRRTASAGRTSPGTVEAVGSGVTRFKPGDEVFGCVRPARMPSTRPLPRTRWR